MTTLAQQLIELERSKQSHVLVTLVGIRGSAPQEIGSKMLVTEVGLCWGTVGGGKIEAHCIKHAMSLLKNKKDSEMNKWNLQKDIGMSCGGEVSLFFDVQNYRNWTIAIFGAGHVSQELCRVIQTWNCHIKVFDTRSEWIEKLPESPNLERNLVQDLSKAVTELSDGTYLISMTQGHATDLPILKVALDQHERFSYLGVIGSRLKGEKLKKELRENGIAEAGIERLFCPVGLPFGDSSPPEIAISIAAQLLSHRDDLMKGES